MHPKCFQTTTIYWPFLVALTPSPTNSPFQLPLDGWSSCWGMLPASLILLLLLPTADNSFHLSCDLSHRKLFARSPLPADKSSGCQTASVWIYPIGALWLTVVFPLNALQKSKKNIGLVHLACCAETFNGTHFTMFLTLKFKPLTSLTAWILLQRESTAENPCEIWSSSDVYMHIICAEFVSSLMLSRALSLNVRNKYTFPLLFIHPDLRASNV